MNEEELKTKIVIPVLKIAGFSENDWQLERSFTVQLGRNNYEVGGESLNEALARPRADILITRNGENLCILETKAVDLDLKDADVRQARSYALLLDPIAPLILVTNGRETRFLASISLSNMADSVIDIGELREAEIGLGDQFAYALLKEFVSLSPGNLVKLCTAQSKAEVSILTGDKNSLRAKYVPELYMDWWSSPLYRPSDYGDAKIVILLGEMGQGKSSLMCHTTNVLLQDDHPCFFFRASSLYGGVWSAIAEEVRWNLSPGQSDIEACTAFLDLLGDKRIVLLVDGIDVIRSDEARQIVESFLNRVQTQHGVTMICSCRPASLASLVSDDGGVPTRLGALLASSSSEAKIVSIPTPNDIQYESIEAGFRSAYCFDGGITRLARERFRRNLFEMRLAFYSASRTGMKRIAYDSSDFFEVFFDELVLQWGSDPKVTRTLVDVARRLFELGTEALRRFGEECSGIDESAIETLISLRVLEQYGTPSDPRIRFEMPQLWTYLVASSVLGLMSADSSRAREIIREQDWSLTRLPVLERYYSLRPDELNDLFDDSILQEMQSLIDLYWTILNTELPLIVDRFPPYSKEGVDFLGLVTISPKTIIGHGLIPSESEPQKVRLEVIPSSANPFTYFDGRLNTPITFPMVSGYYEKLFSAPSMTFNLIQREILDNLSATIESGALNEEGCTELQVEKLFGIWSMLHPIRDLVKTMDEVLHGSKVICLGDMLSDISKAGTYPRIVDELAENLAGLMEERLSAEIVPSMAVEIAKIHALNHDEGSLDELKAHMVRVGTAFFSNYTRLCSRNFPNISESAGLMTAMPLALLMGYSLPLSRPQQIYQGYPYFFVHFIKQFAKIPSNIALSWDVNSQEYSSEGGLLLHNGEKMGVYYRSHMIAYFGLVGQGKLGIDADLTIPLLLRHLVYSELNRDLDVLMKVLQDKYRPEGRTDTSTRGGKFL